MAAHSPSLRFNPSYKRKTVKILDYGKQECMNAINNNTPKISAQKQVETFGIWLKKLMDDDRNNIGLYLADECVLQWFGRTIKSKKDVSGFLKYDMNYTIHHLISIVPCETIILRKDAASTTSDRKVNRLENSDEELATPISDVVPSHIVKSLRKTPTRSPTNKRTRSVSSSPEALKISKKKHKTLENNKKIKTNVDLTPDKLSHENIHIKYDLRSKNNKKVILDSADLKKNIILNSPSTSGNRLRTKAPDKSLNLSYLPRSYMEAKCILKFTTNRSKKGMHLNECERQCKLQVAYSENPVCKGEYIIWIIAYTDNNKCRRNLLPDFEAVSKKSESEK